MRHNERMPRPERLQSVRHRRVNEDTGKRRTIRAGRAQRDLVLLRKFEAQRGFDLPPVDLHGRMGSHALSVCKIVV